MVEQTNNETSTGNAEDVSSIVPAHPSTKQATYALTDVLMPNVCPAQRKYTCCARKCTQMHGMYAYMYAMYALMYALYAKSVMYVYGKCTLRYCTP
jgi:hypothetical protein